MSESRVLPLYPLPGLVSYFEPSQELPAHVEERSPAILVMTDLRHQIAVTIEPNTSIAWALHRMKTIGVRLLFVINADKQILGLITSTDILGEKPLQFHRELRLHYEEIMVRDIMTPQRGLEVLQMEDVLNASVGDIVATLQTVGRRHALVMDNDARNHVQAIRGIFSASQISKQLDLVIDPIGVAQTFVEVEIALNR
jgi:CBS-domain-containing membrane protein